MRSATRVMVLLAIGTPVLGAVILTAMEPAWIEATAGVNPDLGSGILEWVLVLALAAVALVAGYINMRRLRTRDR